MTRILPITKLVVGEVPPLVLVCGDPARAEKSASFLKNSQLVSSNREFFSHRGTYRGEDVLVCSHGVGAPGAAIAFEELIAAGARQIIRIGTCGGIKGEVVSGDLVIATAAISDIGYARDVVPPNYPASADPFLTVSLHQATRSHTNGRQIHTGLIITRDTFYPGPGSFYTPSYETLAQGNVLAVEMECAALFIVGSLRRVRTAAILAVDGNVLAIPESMTDYNPDRTIVTQAVSDGIEIALDALVAS